MTVKTQKKIVIKELPRQQINLIKTLWRQLNQHHLEVSKLKDEFRNYTFEDRLNKIQNKRLKIFIGYDQGSSEIIGYCIVSINLKGNKGQINSLFVKEEVRRENIGEKLMQRSLDWLEKNNIEYIKLEVVVGNEKALNFYEKFGFKPKTYNLKK